MAAVLAETANFPNNPFTWGGLSASLEQPAIPACIHSDMAWRFPNRSERDYILTSFNDLRLSEPLLKALAAEGYDKPTPIQARAIPSLLEGKDLLGIAQTGTGKTAAFALPILERLSDRKSVV